MAEEIAVRLEEGAGDFDRFKRRVVQFTLGYLGLVCLAVYVDYRIRLRRARKKRGKETEKETAK